MLRPEEIDALLLSLKISATAVFCTLPFALLTAWILTRLRFPGRFFLDILVHLPLILPPVLIGYILLILFGKYGIIGGWLFHTFDLQLTFTWQGAALSTAVVAFPFMVRSMRLALEAIPPNVEKVAKTLGANALDVFFTITLPLMTPGILAGILTGFASALGAFGAVITFVSNIPGQTRTLPLAIYTALQLPDGEMMATRLALLSFTLALAALLLHEMCVSLTKRWTKC